MNVQLCGRSVGLAFTPRSQGWQLANFQDSKGGYKDKTS